MSPHRHRRRGAAPYMWVLLVNSLASILAEFYIQFRRERAKSLVGKILGNDYYDQPEWRIYSCRNHEDYGNHGDQPKEFVGSSAIFQCTRFTPAGWPKCIHSTRHSIHSFYTEINFYRTYQLLDSAGVHFEFSDIRREQLPAEIWMGSGHVVQCPRFYRTPKMLEFYREKTEGWLSIVPDKVMQENLIAYLAAPDISWAYGSPNVTAAYLRAYVAYLGVVVTEFDIYMLYKDRPMKMPDAPLDWRGPAWLDWKLLKPAKKVYNIYRKKVDKMHGLWLLDPLLESRLRKMIPVLTSKMVDPCFLQDVASYFPNRAVFRGEQFLGNPEDMLCAVYCRFSHAVTSLFRSSSSKVCYFMDAGNKRHGGQCRADRCYCLKQIEGKEVYRLSIPLRYCINVFNMQRYNDTHDCRIVS